ncbi:MAG: DUF1738 domain-containing protein [Candidatus Riflebacteria bacterium]|nr:DUF1738 domain-containing protein [Candidatus Riflebacteria bacterium]
MARTLREPFQKILDTILDLLEKGTIPWRKPWGAVSPANFVTKRPYSGINEIVLWSAGFSSPWWMTGRQLEKLGGRLKPDAFPHLIVGAFLGTPRHSPGPIAPEPRLYLRPYLVFNLDQVEGVKAPPVEEKAPLPGAAAILRAYRHHPRYAVASGAHYQPSTDTIGMPPMRCFDSSAEYYVTLFHELGHSTAHPSRLDREWKNRTHAYAREELTAELCAAFLMAAAGLEFPEATTNQAAYLQHWRRNLLDDPMALFEAARAAQKASNFILMRSGKQARKPSSRMKAISTKNGRSALDHAAMPSAEPEKRSA